MGDKTNSNMRLGYTINKRTPAKIISILMVLLMVSTVFSSAVFAEKPIEKIKDRIIEIIDNIVDDAKETIQDTTNENRGKFLTSSAISELSALRKGVFSPSLVTKYKDVVKTVRLKQFLPTAIDVDGDGDKDIRVWVIRRPAIDLRPPAVCLKTSLWVRRLAGMDSLKDSSFEIYLEYTPDRISNLLNVSLLERIRIGYESPRVEDVPKFCVVSYKYIPHVLYPRKLETHRISINPGTMVGKAPLNLLFSIADMENNVVKSEISMQINHSPAVKNEISFARSKDHFIRRGQTLEISRKNVVSSNITVTIKDTTKEDAGSVKIENIPKKITLSWLLSKKGHLELNTYGSGTGPVDAAVNGAVSLGFLPTTGVNFRLGWNLDGFTLQSLGKKGKSFDLTVDARGSATLSDLYVNVPQLELSTLGTYNLELRALLLSFALKGGATIGNLALKPSISLDSIDTEVTNLDVVLKNCTVDLEPVQLPAKPTVSITYPKDNDVVSGTVIITGTAQAYENRTIDQVQVLIYGKTYNATGTNSWSYSWDTTTVPNGIHNIDVKCLDSDGYEGSDRVTVKVENDGANWYPSVEISYPSENQILSGVVNISGTAHDSDGTISKVQVRLIKGTTPIKNWIDATGTDLWSYSWDTSKVTFGKYIIQARSYDDKDVPSNVASVEVWVKIKVNLSFTISDASIDVSNLVFEKVDLSGNKTGLTVTSFNADGSGSLTLGDKAVSLSGEGDLKIVNTSIFTTNASAKTMLLDNLAFNFNGEGYLEVSKGKLALELDASIDVTADNIIGTKNITFGAKGKASADIIIEEQSGVKVGDEEDYFDFNVTDLVIKAGGINVSADRISASGTGTIYIKDKKIKLSSDSLECHIDDLSVNTDLGVFSVSGNLELSKYGEITAEFVDLFNFSVSYDGLTNLVITDFELEVASAKGTAAIYANSVNIKPDGYAGISYYEDELNITCCVDVSNITLYGLVLSFNESFYGPFNVTGDFSACFTLNSDLKIDFGLDWIRITIGGNGRAGLNINAQLRNINNYRGYLAADMSLASGSDSFVINISNISGNIHLDVFGSAVLSLDLFELYLENCTTDEELVNISIENFMVSFGLNASIEKSEMVLIVEDAGLSLDNGHVYISMKEKVNVSLYGTIDVDMSANLSGSIKLVSNETGLQNLSVDFTGDVHIEITNLYFAYVNKIKSTNIALEVGLISINGNADIHITKDYIEAGIGVGGDTKTEGGTKESEGSQDESGILIEDFLFNATLASLDFNVLVEFDVLDIAGGLRINIDEKIVINTSGDVTLDEARIVFNSDNIGIFIAADIGLFEITGGGGGTVIVDKNLGLISGSTINTNFVLENTSFDIIIKDLMLFMTLEDADVSFFGSDVVATIDFSDGFKMNASLAGDSYITVNTLWGYLTYLVAMEIRVKNLLITGPTTITANIDINSAMPALVTINAEDGISVDEFSLVGTMNLYGVDGGPEISIGVDDTFNFIIGIDGLWHFDMILVPMAKNLIVNNIDFNGKIYPIILGFGSGFSWVHLEGSVIEPSTIYLLDGKAKIELEPGDFIITFEGLNTLGGKLAKEESDDIITGQFDLFIYSDASLKFSLYNIFTQKYFTFMEGKGLWELTLDINSFELLITGERDIDIQGDFKGNGDFKLFNRNLTINGSGECHLNLEISGSILTGDLYGNVDISWERTRTTYLTFFNFIRLVVQNSGQINLPIGYNQGSEEVTLETEEAVVVINLNVQYITILNSEGYTVIQGNLVINENGEIQVINEYTDEPYNLNQIEINGMTLGEILHRLFDNKIRFWIQIHLFGEWIKIYGWGAVPNIQGAVTLLGRIFNKNKISNGAFEIIPGGQLNFTAWYKAGPENEGPYTFVFNYGDGSQPEPPIVVSGSQQPIKAHPNSICHMYTELGTYVVRVTVIDNNGDTATDTLAVKVIERYLGLEGDRFSWDFEKFDRYIGDDGKIHDSFRVINIANSTYSPDAIVNWSIDANINKLNNVFGTGDWSFDRLGGSLLPGQSQIVNFSFTPNLTKTGEYSASIYVNNTDTDESKSVDFIVSYGLVELYPGVADWWRWTSLTGYLTLLVTKGEINEFENVFWVHSKFWETLNWEVCNKTHPNIDKITMSPDEGVINPGDSLIPVKIIVDARNTDFSGGQLYIKIQRVGDEADNDSIEILIKLIDPIPNEDPVWKTPNSHTLNWWYYPRRAYDDDSSSFSSYRRLHSGWTGDPLILKLNVPISCCGFRINAKTGDNLDRLEVKLYNDTTLQFTKTFNVNEWNNYDWTYWNSTTGNKIVNRAEIKMRLSSGTFKLHWAVIREFDFKKA